VHKVSCIKILYKVNLLKVVCHQNHGSYIHVFIHLPVITTHRKYSLAVVMDNPQHKKTHKGGGIVRIEPYDMQLLDSDPLIREAFQRVGCITFCQKMQRGIQRLLENLH
jgi:hypothetical protein